MLKAGFSITDISPEKGVQLAGYPHCPRPNEGVHDPLYAACMYLDNGNVRHAFITCDLLFFAKPYVKELRSKFDFTITVTVSHTHSGPWVSKIHEYEQAEGVYNSPEYIAWLMNKLEALVKEAAGNTFEAELGTYSGYCGAEQGVGGNRRVKGGTADPSLNIIAVKDKIDTVRGVLLNYALHPTYLHAENLLVTADYPGYIRRYLSFARPEAVFMFAQGTSGDQSSRYHRVAQDFEEACRVGTTLGVEVDHALDRMEFSDDISIDVKSLETELPQKVYPPIEEAEEAMKKARARFESLRNADYITMRNAELDKFGAEDIYYLAIEAASGYKDENLPCEIQAVKLGDDTVIIGTQGEIFVDYGLEIKEASSLEKTFVFELTNGILPGYIYTPDAAPEGGYEVGNSTFTPDAGSVIVETAKKLL